MPAEEPEKNQKKEAEVRVVDRRWWARNDHPDVEDTSAGARKPTYVEDLERRLNDTTAQLQAMSADHRRAVEEFEQAKLRIRREVAREVERGRRAVIAELLEVLDNIDRAAAAAREQTKATGADAIDTLVRGVELVRDQFLAKLQNLGVVRIPAIGQAFDASRHEAVTTTSVPGPEQDGVVVAVVKEGYTINDDLLRPASVVVGR